jgi:hypothetical protein
MNLNEALKNLIAVESNIDARKNTLTQLGFKNGDGATVGMLKNTLNHAIRQGVNQDATEYLKKLSENYNKQRPVNAVKREVKPSKISKLDKIQMEIARLESIIAQLESKSQTL